MSEGLLKKAMKWVSADPTKRKTARTKKIKLKPGKSKRQKEIDDEIRRKRAMRKKKKSLQL